MTAFIFSRAAANKPGNSFLASDRNGASLKASSSASVAAALRTLVQLLDDERALVKPNGGNAPSR
jgi:hypothetical protein